jgi:hypothetical protein
MTDYEAALARIENAAMRTCYGCGDPQAKWTQPMLVALPDVGGGVIKDEGLEAFVYACTSCGYLRLFATELAP